VALRGVLRLFFRGLVRPPLPIGWQRAVLRALSVVSPTPGGLRRTRECLNGVPCEWLRPTQDEGRVLLYLHGGVYLIGSPATHRSLCAHLAKHGRFAVCALDYRLAPEHPYPAARDDAVAAYRGLLEQGYGPERIVIGGDSAGGNLCLITALQLKVLGLPMPAALLCFSPWADLGCGQLHRPMAGDPVLHPAWLHQAVEIYCPPELDACDPGLSPLYADLSGLPPLLIQVGEDELLLNDSLRLAERAKACGVPVELQRYAGLWHVFQFHAGLLRAADQALARALSFIHTNLK